MCQYQSSEEIIQQGKFLQLVREGKWEYVNRTTCTGVIAIMGITNNQELIFIEEYRTPIHQRCISVPAGTVGDENAEESELTAAIREFQEEAGFSASSWRRLYNCPTSPGLTSETITIYEALDVTRSHAGGGVDSECIITHLVPILDFNRWVTQMIAEGCAIDTKVYLSYYHFCHKSPFMFDSRRD